MAHRETANLTPYSGAARDDMNLMSAPAPRADGRGEALPQLPSGLQLEGDGGETRLSMLKGSAKTRGVPGLACPQSRASPVWGSVGKLEVIRFDRGRTDPRFIH